MKNRIVLFTFLWLLASFLGSDSLLAVHRHQNPILVVATSKGFGTYLGEILRAEGFNEFQVESPEDPGLSSGFLKRFDVVLLAETSLTPVETRHFEQYVKEGGNLVAFRPDSQLAKIFGIVGAGEDLMNGYLKLESGAAIGKGLAAESLQIHTEAAQYRLSGAATLASLYRSEHQPTGGPAVAWNAYGKGRAVAFSYNLPQSIVFTRQGNPLHAGQEKDGIPGIRAADLFTSGWVDPSKNALNQADEQMRLLARIVETLAAGKKPLPRLWYFPSLHKGLVMLTDDGENSPEADLEAHLADVKNRGGRMTLYLKGDYLPANTVKRWASEGFEISGHVDDTQEAIHPTYQGMDLATRSMAESFQRAYGLKMETVRNHWIVWCGRNDEGTPDFAAQAAIETKHGIRFDCNLYHYDQESSQEHFLGPVGSFTGSGLPMKFAGLHGKILDIYGSVTQLPDEQWGPGNMFNHFRILLDRSLDSEIFSYINLNFHTERWKAWSRAEGLEIIDYAKHRQVPLWTVAQVLDFLDTRAAARFSQIRWRDSRLSFRLEVPASEPGVTLMLPYLYDGKKLQKVFWDGCAQSFTVSTIKGVDYAFLGTSSGIHKTVAMYGMNF